MKRSDEILVKASNENRSLTKSERGELREAYLWEQEQERKLREKVSKEMKEYRDQIDPLNMPRHRAYRSGIPFHECPICFKNRNTDTSDIRIANFMKENPDDFCMKKSIHNERVFNMMIVRERIVVKSEPKG